jgi:hypothetical protein
MIPKSCFVRDAATANEQTKLSGIDPKLCNSLKAGR